MASPSLVEVPTESGETHDPGPTTSNQSKNDGNDVQIPGAPAVVAWVDDVNKSQPRHLSHSTHEHLTLQIHRNASSNTAFFQLRANVALKTRRDRTNAFLSIHPERILSIEVVDEDDCIQMAAQNLGTSVYCLQFRLSSPPALVVPKGDLTPKHKASRLVLDSLQALAKQTSLAVYLPSTTLAKTRLLSLCEAASSGSLRSTQKFVDVASLYGGNGGRVIEHEAKTSLPAESGAGNTGTQVESPPSYDELGFGHSPPRVPPIQKSGKKRRRDSSSSDHNGPACSHQCVSRRIENMCTKMMERIEQGFNELGSRMDRMDQRLTALEFCVEHHADKLGINIDGIQQRSSEQVDELRDELEKGLYDVRKETDETVNARIEDEMFVVRQELEDCVKDEMANMEDEVEERLQEHLSTANVSLEFNWNR